MNLTAIEEIWSELSRYIGLQDRRDAAETLVNLLIEQDYEIDDIKEALGHDSDIKTALKQFQDEVEEESDEDHDDDDDDY